MKRGQMKISFGMIFSIILIVVFLAFSFFAIKTFLGFQSSAKAGTFLNSLQNDVDRVWKSAQSSQQETYTIPDKVQYVCFVDFTSPAQGQNKAMYSDLEKSFFGTENIVFHPFGSSDIDSREIKHIDLVRMTSSENPFCIKSIDGKITITLKKDFSDSLVTITR